MGGNRKHGYRRGNANGRNGNHAPDWFCDACQKTHKWNTCKNKQLCGLIMCNRQEEKHYSTCGKCVKIRIKNGLTTSLKSALEAALNGKATRQDVIAAIDAELAADPEPYSMVEGEGAGQYTFDTPKDSQLAMF